MKKSVVLLVATFFISTTLFAKTLDQKKDELKRIYEVGGISKVEYKKAIEFLENPKENEKKENKTKKAFSLKKNKKKTNNPFKNKKDEDEEEITFKKIDELGEPIQFDNDYFPESMVKMNFKGCNDSFKCKGDKAGKFLFKAFNKKKKYQQKNPGELIKAMAMYEVFYAAQLWNARKTLERYKENKYNNFFSRKKDDEKKIRSLFGMSKGQISMREALGMNSETTAKDAIKKFWLLGDFLELGTAVKHEKLSADLKKRQNLLQEYKQKITSLKKKLQEDLEEDDEKSIE
jgi:hypothetical protein